MERRHIWKPPPPIHSLGSSLPGGFLTLLAIFVSVFNDATTEAWRAAAQGSDAARSHVAARAPRVALWGGGAARWGGSGEGGRGPGAPPAGSGAKGQAEGSARGAGAAARVTAARPSHPQLRRGGRGGLGPSPAVCISLAGGGAWVERNRLHLERCLFFLTMPRRQTTSGARRPDSAGP